jgi:hypothetical protein
MESGLRFKKFRKNFWKLMNRARDFSRLRVTPVAEPENFYVLALRVSFDLVQRILSKNSGDFLDRVPTARCRGDAELFLDDCIRVKTAVLHSPPETEHCGSDDV